jgi:hypothetical protein
VDGGAAQIGGGKVEWIRLRSIIDENFRECGEKRSWKPNTADSKCRLIMPAAIEARMETKVRKGYQHDNRLSPKLIYAKFVHGETRPVDRIFGYGLHRSDKLLAGV